MSHRQHRKAELAHKREERAEQYNGKRKQRYSLMAKDGILGNEDLKKYEELRVAIKRDRADLARKGIQTPCFPTENITRANFDSVKNFYYTYICPRCPETEEPERETEFSHLDTLTEALDGIGELMNLYPRFPRYFNGTRR